jgi:dTDP-4-dehydrorhamnose reductase
VSRIVVTGSAGQLGRQLVLDAVAAGHEVVGLGRHEPEPVDLTDAEAVARAVRRAAPDAIVHAAAWTAVDDCEHDPRRAEAVNAAGTRHVVDAARFVDAHVVYVSTDYVFDGTKPTPYVETDPTNPLSVYGRTKLAGEQQLAPHHTVARTSWLCGAHGPNMVRTILRLAAEQHELRFVDDQVGHPTFTADLAPVLLALATRREPGTFHVTNQGATSWYGFARDVLAAAGLDPDRVRPVATADLPARAAPRPANSVLDNAALRAIGLDELPHHRTALSDLVAHLGEDRPPA